MDRVQNLAASFFINNLKITHLHDLSHFFPPCFIAIFGVLKIKAIFHFNKIKNNESYKKDSRSHRFFR